MFDLFDSVLIGTTLTIEEYLSCLAGALGCGLLTALASAIRTRASKSFLISLALLPMIVATVIMMVNGNVGAGVAVMGAFNLVRFRSVPGSAREISFIFLSMAVGLATGMGYLTFAAVITVVVALILIVLGLLPAGMGKKEEKLLRVVMPEDLDYAGVFDDIFEKYTSSCSIDRVKTTNLGSMFEVSYIIQLKDAKKEKEMIDEIRCRNGNLTIICSRHFVPNDQL